MISTYNNTPTTFLAARSNARACDCNLMCLTGDYSFEFKDIMFEAQSNDINVTADPPLVGDEGIAHDVGLTTGNIASGVVETAAPPRPLELPTDLMRLLRQPNVADVDKALARPFRWKRGIFSLTSPPSERYNIFDPLLVNPLYMGKVTGHAAIRADTVFTLQATPTRFTAGRVILAYLPLGGISNHSEVNSNLSDTINTKLWSLTQVTQLPHVELDFSTQTEVTLRIPFQSYTNASWIRHTVDSVIQSPGQIVIYMYSWPAGSITEVPYSLYVHYENAELYCPIIAQSGISKAALDADLLGSESKQAGPIETGSRMAFAALDYASKVPLLSSVATPLSWVAAAMAQLSSLYGWSRPIETRPAIRTRNELASNMPCANSKDVVTCMSINDQNRVSALPGFAATDVDEMSFAFLKSIPTYYATLTWATSAAVDTRLFQSWVSPTNFMSYSSSGPVTRFGLTPIGLLGGLFAYYRGGVRLHIKLVKTEFHSGRFMIAYLPVDEADKFTWSGGTDDFSSAIKTIIDIKAGTDFTFDLPYLSITPWKSTGDVVNTDAIAARGEPYGIVLFTVLNKLVAPATVASEIKIIIEVSGMEDLEFAVPKEINFCPILTAQSGEFSVGDYAGPVNSLAAEQACIGETIQSLRTLMKIPSPVQTYTASYGSVYPEVVHYPVVVDSVLTNTNTTHDYYSILSAAYALRRGSLRLRMVPTSIATESFLFTALSTLPYTQLIGRYFADLSNPITVASMVLHLRGMLSEYTRGIWGNAINVPFYSKTPSKPTIQSTLCRATEYIRAGVEGAPTLRLKVITRPSNVDVFVYRYGGDDFSFGAFNGAPVVMSVAA